MEWLQNNVTFFTDAVPKDSSKTASQADLRIANEETGMDRLRRMFSVNEFDEITPEANIILHAGAMSLFVGAIYGGFMSSRVAYMNFIENNQATAFKDHLEAKKKLQDAVTKSFGKGAYKWGWRLGAFTTSYVGLSTTISVYRGKSGILEHVAAGAITGFLYKFTAGPRAWVVGCGLGMALGTIAGSCTYGILKLTGMTMEEVRYWNYQWKQTRNKYQQKVSDAQIAENELVLLKERSELYGRHGVNLGNIPDQPK